MGPGTGDCYSTGATGCTFTVSGTAVPDNAVAFGAGTVDKLKVQLDASPGTTTSRSYTFVACQAVETLELLQLSPPRAVRWLEAPASI